MEKHEFISAECKSCGKKFKIFGREAAFYEKNNLELPKRCRLCREKRKATKSINKV